jgi:hypothetical protein
MDYISGDNPTALQHEFPQKQVVIQKQINLAWEMKSVREIPIIDAVCHYTLKGSDVPVLQSSFACMGHRPILELPGRTQKREKREGKKANTKF